MVKKNNMVENYMAVLKKYAQFDGRSRRAEYWQFFLANIIVAIIISLLNLIPVVGEIAWILSVLYSLAVFVPGLAVCIRRLHDINKPWHWMFFSCIPVVGGIWFIVLLATEGTKGDNQFGSDPKI